MTLLIFVISLSLRSVLLTKSIKKNSGENMDEDKFITVAQAAERVERKDSSIRQLINRGKLPFRVNPRTKMQEISVNDLDSRFPKSLKNRLIEEKERSILRLMAENQHLKETNKTLLAILNKYCSED